MLENKLPHLLFGNTSDILWILDGINSAEVGACLDTGHAYLRGDIHNLVHKPSGHLRMIQALTMARTITICRPATEKSIGSSFCGT